MSVKTKDEILSSVKSLLGDTPDDKGIVLLEDISDTFDNSTSGSSDEDKKTIEELKLKLEETDKAWRQKYADRFLNPNTNPPADDSLDDAEDDNKDDDNSPKKFEDLFSSNDN